MSEQRVHLEARTVEFLRVRGLLEAGSDTAPRTHLLVATSGGRDSTVLAHVAARIAAAWKGRLTLAHVHHGLRGEADAEEAFVAALAGTLQAGFLSRRVDVRAEMFRSGASLQDAARTLRYRALEEMRAEAGASVILTAHHADDQAETLLAHFLRGAGPEGLQGIRPVHGRVARPLLEVRGEDIDRYAEAEGVRWIEDASNATDAYRRNVIRHHITPAVRDVFGSGWVAALGGTARLYGLLASFLRQREEHWVPLAIAEEDGSVLVRENSLNGSAEFEKLTVCRSAIRRFRGDEPSLTECLSLLDLFAEAAGAVRRLGDDVTAQRTQEGLRLFAVPRARPAVDVRPGARVPWGRWTLEAQVLDLPDADPGTRPGYTADPFEEIIDLDAAGERWRLREWAPDDRFEPLGFGREKAVGSFLADSGYALARRRAIPVLEGEGGILWVCGVRLARLAAIHAGSRRFCRLRYFITDSSTS